ncbi:contactin-5-like [Mya arenaria]|uniref:contactin-5-like n=1 Tax=Mya arenaria TaxID=6604 RepID=UPI0022DE979A|nr:contactin-5-like [Mya arenaria]
MSKLQHCRNALEDLIICVILVLEVNQFAAGVSGFTISIREGQEVTLPCMLPPGGMSGYTVAWMFGHKQISENEKITAKSEAHRMVIDRPHKSDWFLRIGDTKKSDAGVYVCLMDRTVVVNAKLVIEYPPSITGYKSFDVHYRVCEGTPRVTLWCNVTGVPRPTIRWFYLKTQTSERKYIGLLNEMVVLPEVGPSTQGLYRCEVSNLHGKDALTYHIDVIERSTRVDSAWTYEANAIPDIPLAANDLLGITLPLPPPPTS